MVTLTMTLNQFRVENEGCPMFWGACEQLVYKPDDCQLVGLILGMKVWEYIVMENDSLFDADTNEEVNMDYFMEDK